MEYIIKNKGQSALIDIWRVKNSQDFECYTAFCGKIDSLFNLIQKLNSYYCFISGKGIFCFEGVCAGVFLFCFCFCIFFLLFYFYLSFFLIKSVSASVKIRKKSAFTYYKVTRRICLPEEKIAY